MNRSVLTLLLLIAITGKVIGQSNFASDSIIEFGSGVVEKFPTFAGGEEGLKSFIDSILVYPSVGIENKIEGIVYVLTWVDICGNTSKHMILNEIQFDIDQEALRVTRLVKFKEPAKIRGIPVEIKYIIPVEFKLSNLNEKKKE
jgi:hypothetical protein